MDLRLIINTVADYRDQLFGGSDMDPEQRRRNRASSSAAAELARDGVPPLPESARELLRILRDPHFRTRDVVAVLESDPALTAEIIHLANSAANARIAPCDTAAKAFTRLGARAVVDLAVTAHVMALGANATGAARDAVNHSVRVATIVRGLPTLRAFSAERLFLCGLVHDIGIQLLSAAGEFHYTRDLLDDPDLCELETRRLRFDHATLGAVAMKMWEVPDPVSRIVAWHHHLDQAIERGGDVAYMVATLSLAEALDTNSSANGYLSSLAAANIANRADCQFLGLTADDLELLWETTIADELMRVHPIVAQAA